MPENADGYVKYSADHRMTEAAIVPDWKKLNDARTRLHQMGLVGALPGGVGFGNVSMRVRGNEFLISGTATGAPPVLKADQYCLIESFDLERNHVVSAGPVGPSSESMTHGAVYEACPGTNCVLHIHSRIIFDGMVHDRCPATPAVATYGSPEIALAIQKRARDSGKNEGCIVMLGHDEGVIAYGPSVERAFELVMDLHARYSGRSKSS